MPLIRINTYLQKEGYASRRGADTLIEKGIVFVNGEKATIGQKIDAEKDTVTVEGKDKLEYIYCAYYKPRGIVTVNAQDEEEEIKDVLNDMQDKSLFPVGRLDKESEGLIILTNDGRVTSALTGKDTVFEKEYRVSIDRDITNTFIQKMRNGVTINIGIKKYVTKPTQIRKVTNTSFDIILTEGKNRQIRKMSGACGGKVTMLKRIRIETISLGRLKAGQLKLIKGDELKEFLTLLNIK
ncbi:MAG: 23S rRNA pseudouridine2604 synthase [Flavobacteriaceae bacterium]|jgi:23S rRNA pseudouridine2604 synthase